MYRNGTDLPQLHVRTGYHMARIAASHGPQSTCHFFVDCPQFKENLDSIWHNLKIIRSNLKDGIHITNFVKNLGNVISGRSFPTIQ